MKRIGVLALQGDFARHAEMVIKTGREAIEVRTGDQLKRTDALIIPGGESSTFLKMINRFNLFENIRDYANHKPVMGTCAGLIISATQADGLESTPLGLIDISVMRNAYGRQKESFIDDIIINLNGKEQNFTGVFIRAPKIESYGSDVQPLGFHNDDVVMAGNDRILVCTFHPELADNPAIHEYFFTQYHTL